jgi:uncharacterized protein YeaO (DUF488 family)
MAFQIKRIYEPPSPSDGTRVLVDRLWPELRKLGKGKPVTLLYAAHDPKVNHALVLKSALSRR